jgi:hypothetical protein
MHHNTKSFLAPGFVPAGTPILTSTGYIPVELLKVGDVAIGLDEHTLEPILVTITAMSEEMTHKPEIE